jgi:hypothetical protein
MMQFNAEASLLTDFCLDDLSIDGSRMLKSQTIIVSGSICPFISSSIWGFVAAVVVVVLFGGFFGYIGD